ncbi:YxeA family protein [Bacillus sp. S14(2024)]|uniref:YxeA family protein n=1 Tax=Bacillus sp. S14(2024) TaxID=3162884 RepID=UPI003D1C2A10
MKKILLGIIGLIIGLGAFMIVGTGNADENIDRLNPFVKEKVVYVLTKGEGKPDPGYPGRYMYILNGVDESGQEGEVKVGTAAKDEFQENTYLKLRAKGKYVFEFKEVQEKDVPEKAKEKLKK